MTAHVSSGLVQPGPPLEPERIVRYSRQLMLPGFGEAAQRRLRAVRVLVIGAGGLGSAIVPILAGTGIGVIGVADDDLVEPSNLARQLSHGVADIGRPKTDSLAETVHAIDPACEIVVHRERVTAQNLPALLSGYDLLVDGSDNFPTRYLANDAAELAGIPLVWGSILRYQGQVGIAWAAHGPTFRDLFPTPPPADETLSCELGGVLPSLCTAIGSLMATEVVKLVTGIGDPLLGRVLFYDALTARTREIAYAADPERMPVTELIDYELFCGAKQEPDAADVAGAAVSAAASAASVVSAAEVLQRVRSGEPLSLLDVREPHETALRRIPGSVLLPIGRLEAGEAPSLPEGAAVIVYCEQGPRSVRAVRELRARGIEARHLAGGIRSYAAIGGDLIEGELS